MKESVNILSNHAAKIWKKYLLNQKVISSIKREDKRFGENAKLYHVPASSIRQSDVCCVATVTLHATPYIASYTPLCLMAMLLHTDRAAEREGASGDYLP